MSFYIYYNSKILDEFDRCNVQQPFSKANIKAKRRPLDALTLLPTAKIRL